MSSLFDVIEEDSDLLAINKPAGLVCHPTKGDELSSLVGRIRLYLDSGANTHVINRLDRETSGVILVAKSRETASDLRRIWESRRVQKSYLAVVHGHVPREHGVIDEPLGQDEHSVIAIKDCVRADGAVAQTAFEVLRCFSRAEGDFSLLRVRPRTGRKHQIRIHLAHVGHPIIGDKLYGGDELLFLDFVKSRLTPAREERLILPYQALHAEELRFAWRGSERAFRAPPEDWLRHFVAGK